VSDYFNVLAKAAYDWFAYIDAGLWDDDLHVTGTLIVDGLTTINDDVAITGSTSIGGDVTVGGNAVVTGEVTATDYNHSDHTATCDLGGAIAASGSVSYGWSSGLPTSVVSNPGAGAYALRGLRTGDRFKSCTFLTANGDTPTYLVYKSNLVTGISTNLPSSTIVSLVSPFPTTVTLTTPVTLALCENLYMLATNGAGATLTLKTGITVTFDHP
jgi:hypothetical protein